MSSCDAETKDMASNVLKSHRGRGRRKGLELGNKKRKKSKKGTGKGKVMSVYTYTVACHVDNLQCHGFCGSKVRDVTILVMGRCVRLGVCF